MAGGCLDNTVRIWNVATLKEQYRLTNASYAVAFTSDGKKLHASAPDGIACWWDFRVGAKQSCGLSLQSKLCRPFPRTLLKELLTFRGGQPFQLAQSPLQIWAKVSDESWAA